MSVLKFPIAADLLLLYARDSLREQVEACAAKRPDWQMELSFERSLPEIRKLLCGTGAVLVDATDDPGQATDAFLQAVTRLGAKAVTMYSDRVHDGLELFVRVRGSLFLLGPLFDGQWEELLDRWLSRSVASPVSRASASRRQTLGRENRRQERLVNRFYAGLDWPNSDCG